LKPLSSWCDRYAIDGSGTACCYARPTGNPYGACSTTSLDVPAGRCGDYRLTIVGSQTSYFDAASGDLAAVTWSGEDGSVCLAGPAGGFTAPTCTPSLDPVCPTGVTTTN